MSRTEDQIKQEIKEYKDLLTGNIFQDGEIQQKIYELKKELNPRIEDHPEEDNDHFCENCGS